MQNCKNPSTVKKKMFENYVKYDIINILTLYIQINLIINNGRKENEKII